LKDLDLKDFFRLISSFSGLNIIVDPAVTGTVTMTMTSVPWDQALDIVLKNNQLGKELQGNVLRIAKLSTLQAEEAAVKDLQEAKNLTSDLIQKNLHSELHQGRCRGGDVDENAEFAGSDYSGTAPQCLDCRGSSSQFAKLDRLVHLSIHLPSRLRLKPVCSRPTSRSRVNWVTSLVLCLATRVRTGCREWVRWDRARLRGVRRRA